MKDDKKSIVKEALSDYNEIMEAADANAKKKLAEEFPEKFNNILKEELQNKNKSVKESYKKLDESETNKESVMKNQTKETKKVVKETAGEGKPFDEKAKEVAKVEEAAGEGKPFVEKSKEVEKVEEDVKITDTVGKGDPFDKQAKRGQKVEEAAGEGKPFDKKAKKPLQTEEFDVTGLDSGNVGSAIESAGDNDEILTMEEIEKEISNMEGLDERLTDVAATSSPSYMDKGNKGIAFDQLVQMRNQLDEMIKGAGVDEMHQGQFDINKMHQGTYDEKLIDEKSVDEMHSAGATDGATTFGDTSQVNALHSQGPTDKLIDEENPITDADIEAVLGGKTEQPVGESHGVDYAKRRNVTGRHLPAPDYLSQGEKDQSPEWVQESKKKISSLIGENKKLTKKLNETKKNKESVSTLVEGYKSALEKYRNQLKEMAVFNTNLAHVNNLLVNEELALTQEDKIKIINDFKKIDSIAASQTKYKTVLSEMKESKKTLTESVEEKVTTSIQPSSKQKLDEVVEKTAYADNKHLQRMRKIIETIEHRGKKNNL
jgi:hypothetical protein